MHWDVKTVKPLPDFCIYVETVDGTAGIVDMKPYLERGDFRELKDPHYYSRVDIVLGAVTWPHGQDIAPETLLAGLTPAQQQLQPQDQPAWN